MAHGAESAEIADGSTSDVFFYLSASVIGAGESPWKRRM